MLVKKFKNVQTNRAYKKNFSEYPTKCVTYDIKIIYYIST